MKVDAVWRMIVFFPFEQLFFCGIGEILLSNPMANKLGMVRNKHNNLPE